MGMLKPLFLTSAFFLLAASALLYYQYTYFRTPITSEYTADQEAIEIQHSIPIDEIVVGNTNKDGIPSIDNPQFESVASADAYLNDAGYGLMVRVDGQYRFYPYQILVWHEIVNDTLRDKELLITYSPLTFSGAVYEREINGQLYEFGVSGQLWNNNLLMYDRESNTLWSQLLGEAVVGQLTGLKLTHYPSYTLTWLIFKTLLPFGEVLSRETGYDRDYTQDPYESEGYYTSPAIWFPLSHEDTRLDPKTIVYGLEINGEPVAFDASLIREAKTIETFISNKMVQLIWDEELETARVFINDEEQIPLQTYWFSWAAVYPETKLIDAYQ